MKKGAKPFAPHIMEPVAALELVGRVPRCCVDWIRLFTDVPLVLAGWSLFQFHIQIKDAVHRLS